MILKKLSYKHILIIILLLSFLTRFYRLDYPNRYVFDEVYHAFTAKEYLKGSMAAWEWWTTPPPGVAFEWTHPPLAKEIMTFSMYVTGSTDPWAYRLPGVIFGVLSIYLVYLLGRRLLNSETGALIAAFVFSIDGLNFVQSRTGMNDIYYVTFVLVSLLFILDRKLFLSAIFFGLAVASKWAAIYLLGMYILLAFYLWVIKKNKLNFLKTNLLIIIKVCIYFLLIPPLIYMLSYLPFFLLGHTPTQFIHLQQQMWWYHTGLKATHNYSSPWWSWPLSLYPVWYFVDYQKNNIANIFTYGNPVLFWIGSVSVVLTLIEFLKNRSKSLFIIMLGCFIFWLPWAFSPRIMFLYHFSPSVPFLSLALAHQFSLEIENNRNRKIIYLLLVLIVLSFALIYPFLTGIPIPKEFVNIFFTTNLSKNPFN